LNQLRNSEVADAENRLLHGDVEVASDDGVSSFKSFRRVMSAETKRCDRTMNGTTMILSVRVTTFETWLSCLVC
jgi:hypothetical protein